MKTFTFKARHGAKKTVGIDAPTLASAVAVYRRLYPSALIAFVTTKPTGNIWNAVSLAKKRNSR